MRCWGAAVYFAEITGPLEHDTEPGPESPSLVAPSLVGEICPEGALTALDGLCLKPGGFGGSEPFGLARAAIIPHSGRIQSDRSDRGPWSRHYLVGQCLVFPAPLEPKKRCARGLACVKTKRVCRPIRRVITKVLGRVATSFPPHTAFFPAVLLGRVNEVDHRVDSYFTAKRVEWPSLMRENSESRCIG